MYVPMGEGCEECFLFCQMLLSYYNVDLLMFAFCAMIVDRPSENVNAAEVAEYEDDFEPEESEKSSVVDSDDGEYITVHHCENKYRITVLHHMVYIAHCVNRP